MLMYGTMIIVAKCSMKWGEDMKKKKIHIIIFAIIICILLLLAFDTRLKVVHYNISSLKVSDDIKLALITDLHSCLYGENQEQLTDAIDNFNPDAIFLGGDIFDDEYINNNSQVLVEYIGKKYKTYYVSGNHEWWSGDMYGYFDYLKNSGVTVLRGDTDFLEINKNKIAIHGIDDPETERFESEGLSHEEQLESAGKNVNPDYFNILISHRSEYIPDYMEYGFDLTLSGHAHGGQARIPFLLNGLFAPNQGFFPEFAGGRYDFEGKTAIVSRGLSRENTKLPRIFNRPEIVFITITD